VYSALMIAAAVYGAFLLGTGNPTIALFRPWRWPAPAC